MQIEDIARICHQLNLEFCITLDDWTQHVWELAPQWQRDSAIAGVKFHMANPQAGDSASHDEWMRHKRADGWTYGPEKDPEKKEHPCMVPFDHLPLEQQIKDRLFRGVVHALIPLLDGAPHA